MMFVTRIRRSEMQEGHDIGSPNYRREAVKIAKERMFSTWPHIEKVRVATYEEFTAIDTIAATITLESRPVPEDDWKGR